MEAVDGRGLWAAASNEQAVTNARVATTACAARRVERSDVALFLAELAEARPAARPAVREGRHPA